MGQILPLTLFWTSTSNPRSMYMIFWPFQFENFVFLNLWHFKSIAVTHHWMLRRNLLFTVSLYRSSRPLLSLLILGFLFSFLFRDQLGAVAVFLWRLFFYFTYFLHCLQVWWMCMYAVNSFSLLERLLSQDWPRSLSRAICHVEPWAKCHFLLNVSPPGFVSVRNCL